MLSTEFCGKKRAGDLGAVNAGPFQIALRKIYSSKIGLPEITSPEIHPCHFNAAQIHTPEISIAQIRFLTGLEAGIEFSNFPVSKQGIHGVVGHFRLHTVIFDSLEVI